jgi:hypothetical protein
MGAGFEWAQALRPYGMTPVRDFQFKKYPKISCSAGIWSPNNTRRDQIPLDSEALLQTVHFFCGVLLMTELNGSAVFFACSYG